MQHWRLLIGTALILFLPVSGMAASQESLEKRVERMELILESKGLMELMRQSTAMQEELRDLRGKNEVLQHELKELKARQRELYLDMDRRLQEIEASGTARTGGATVAPAAAGVTTVTVVSGDGKTRTEPAGPPPVKSNEPTAAERDAYKQAFELLKQGRYDRSITAFQAFLKQYPGSGYAANAQYWLGEANYVSKKYPQALEEFKTVISKYAGSSKVSDARLKLGFTYYELGNWDQARKTLKDLSKDEGGTSIGRLADKRLKRMSQEGH
jgi:tol-pal system protein YbgF